MRLVFNSVFVLPVLLLVQPNDLDLSGSVRVIVSTIRMDGP